MADLAELLDRIRVDAHFRELLVRDPTTALADLALTDDELRRLDVELRRIADPPPGARRGTWDDWVLPPGDR